MYKVGFTRGQLQRRIAALSTGSAQRLREVGTIEVPSDLALACEAYVHSSLADLAAPEAGGREFFKAADGDAILARVKLSAAEYLEFAAGSRSAAAGAVVAGDCCLDDLGQDQRVAIEGLFAERREIAAQSKRLDLKRHLLESVILGRFKGELSAGGQPLLALRQRKFKHVNLEALRSLHPQVAEEVTEWKTSVTTVFH